jgi:hypothetical protein
MTSKAESTVGARRWRRPVAAWLALVLLVVASASATIGAIPFVVYVSTSDAQVVDYSRVVLAVAWRFLLGAGAIVTAVGVLRHRPWSRWAGLCAIGAWAIWTMFRDAQYLEPLQGPSAWFARYMVWPLLCTWWGYAFAFSRKARMYFHVAPGSAV